MDRFLSLPFFKQYINTFSHKVDSDNSKTVELSEFLDWCVVQIFGDVDCDLPAGVSLHLHGYVAASTSCRCDEVYTSTKAAGQVSAYVCLCTFLRTP